MYTVYILYMTTPFFPAWRAQLGPLKRHVQHLRQQSLSHLDLLFGPLLPTGLLSQSDAGPNSPSKKSVA